MVLSSFPLVLNLGWTRQRCGPNQGSSMKAALADFINSGPSALSTLLAFFVSPIMLLTAILAMACSLVVLNGGNSRLVQENVHLHRDLNALRKEYRV